MKESSQLIGCNPCSEVRRTTEQVQKSSKYVTINGDKITEYVDHIISKDYLNKFTRWSDCHFDVNMIEDMESIYIYVFLIDTLNFCFWPGETGYEYENLAKNIADNMNRNPEFLSISHLSTITEGELRSKIFNDLGEFCLMSERARMTQEVFSTLLNLDETCTSFISKALNSADQLVFLLLKYFPNFRDQAIGEEGEQIFFYKRAQILVADLHGVYSDMDDKNRCHLIHFGNSIEQLTMFPDYRIPQLLEHLGIIIYSPQLKTIILSKTLLQHGSHFEVFLFLYIYIG